MATDFTAHYHLDKYVATDKPNLRDQYNAAMGKIDDALYTANTNATDAKATAQRAEGAVSSKASQADLDALSQTVADKASQTDLDALSELLPANQFSSQDTVKALLDAKASQLDLNELSDKVDINEDALSKSNVLLYGGKPMTRSLNWSEIVATAIQNGEGVYFPSGQYYIDSYVNIAGAKFFAVSGCRFIFEGADSKFDFTFPIQPTRFYIIGASFVTTDGTRTAIEIPRDGAHACGHLVGCSFGGFTDAAFINRNLGVQITSCMFTDCNEGCILATDFTITNSGFYSCNHAIHASYRGYDGSYHDHGGFSTILGCQFWVNGTDKPNASFVYTEGEIENLALVGCDFDTTVRLFDARVFRGIVVDSCRFLWDNTIANQKSCLFYIRGGEYTSNTTVITSVSVTNCVFTTPALNSAASTYEIVAFDGEQNALNFGQIANGYESHGCLLHIVPSSVPNTTGHLFAIPLGYVYGYATPSANTAVHYKCAGSSPHTNIDSRLVIHSDFARVKLVSYSTVCKVYFMDSPSDVVSARYGMGSTKFSDIVFSLEYTSVSSILLLGALRNAYLMSDSSTPSNVSKLRVMTEAV